MDLNDPYEHIDFNLMYTTENIATQDTEDQFDEEFIEGCMCVEDCTIQNECKCVLKSGAYYAPSEKWSEHIQDNYIINVKDIHKPIYECNSKCQCYNKTCGHKLVQFGPRKHLKIISCEQNVNLQKSESSSAFNTKGLGLITTEKIRHGSFICEYAGEIITQMEAMKRHEFNKEHGLMNYIFCVNEFSGENLISTYIDPSKFGNIGRYLNHSCQPNCELIPIRVNNTIPKLCIFAAQNIGENCELTFDYGQDSSNIADDVNQKRIKCLCGTALCKKYLPFSK